MCAMRRGGICKHMGYNGGTKDYGSYVYNTHTAAAEPMTGKTTTRYVRRRDFAICENDDITSIAATVASRYD